MAAIIRIKRSSVSGNPATLSAGELAYSALVDNGYNGGDRLYIGIGAETAGNATSHIIIGGKRYTDLVDAATNLNASAAIVKRDVSGNFSAGSINASLVGNASTATTLQTSRTIALTGDATASGSFDGSSNYSAALTLATVNPNVGTFGSSTTIPVVTFNAKGLATAVTTANIVTTLQLAGGSSTTGSVALATGTLTFTGGNGITTSVSSGVVTIAAIGTLATLAGAETLTNKIISGANNTLTIRLDQSDVTGTLPVAKGGTGSSTGSITGTSALTFTAGGANNNVNLVPNGTGIVDVGGKRVGNAADPTQSTDLATKSYVDSLSNGLDVKASVRAATTAALTVTYSNGTSGVGATLINAGTQAALTLDGIAFNAGERVLIKDQISGLQNGIYVVTTVGSSSTNWVLTRAGDFDNSLNIEVSPGTFFFVEEGTTQQNNGYVVSTIGAITIGTTAITFSQFSGAGQLTAGSGLTKSGNNINVVGTTNRISVFADNIDIDSAYAGQSTITTLGTIATGAWQGNIIGPTYGGTGTNNGSNTLSLAGNVIHSGAFQQIFTATANTSVTLPNFGTLATLSGVETFTNKTLTTPTISGALTLSDTTPTTSTTTGALVVAGGVGIGSNLTVGGNVTTTSGIYTGSTSGTTLLKAPAVAGSATTIVLPSTAGTLIGTGDTGTVTNTMLADSIAASKITGLALAAIVTYSGIETLTNKRLTPRVLTISSAANPSINTDQVDQYGLTAQATAISSFTVTGTPTDGQKLWIYIVGTGPQSIVWGTSFESSTVALPNTTVSTNRLDVGFVWNTTTAKWRCVATA